MSDRPQPVVRADPDVLEAMHALVIGEAVRVNDGNELIERATSDRWLLEFERDGERIPVAYLDGNANRIDPFKPMEELKHR